MLDYAAAFAKPAPQRDRPTFRQEPTADIGA